MWICDKTIARTDENLSIDIRKAQKFTESLYIQIKYKNTWSFKNGKISFNLRRLYNSTEEIKIASREITNSAKNSRKIQKFYQKKWFDSNIKVAEI